MTRLGQPVWARFVPLALLNLQGNLSYTFDYSISAHDIGMLRTN